MITKMNVPEHRLPERTRREPYGQHAASGQQEDHAVKFSGSVVTGLTEGQASTVEYMLKVAYIAGVKDNRADLLSALGLRVWGQNVGPTNR